MNYQLSKRVVADLFEGEYIIANLDTGLYYSLQGLGVFLLKNLPFAEPTKVFQKFSEAFSNQKESVLADLNEIWTQLENEAIVVPYLDALANLVEVEIPAVYEPSSFNRYADMQDLLALDPIHEVNEEGWEKKNENGSK